MATPERETHGNGDQSLTESDIFADLNGMARRDLDLCQEEELKGMNQDEELEEPEDDEEEPEGMDQDEELEDLLDEGQEE